MEIDIFIAYHGAQGGPESSYEQAKAVYAALTKEGYRCYLRDPHDASTTYADTPAIARGCGGFLFVLNHHVLSRCEERRQGNGTVFHTLAKGSWIREEIESFLQQYGGVANGAAKGRIACYAEDEAIGDIEIENLHRAFSNVPAIRVPHELSLWAKRLVCGLPTETAATPKRLAPTEEGRRLSRRAFSTAIRQNVSVFYKNRRDTETINAEIENCYTYLSAAHGEHEPLTVLWDARPVGAVNVIHLMYLLKLRELASLGFACRILLFDDTESRERNIPLRDLAAKTAKTVEYFNTFLGQDCCVLESTLSAGTDHKTYMSFLHSYRDTPLGEGSDLRSVLADLNEIFFYREKIRAALLLAGEIDQKSIWNNALLEDTAPLLLVMKNISGISGGRVSPASSHDLISIYTFDDEEARERINAIFASSDPNEVAFATVVTEKIIKPFCALFDTPTDFESLDAFDRLHLIFNHGRNENDL